MDESTVTQNRSCGTPDDTVLAIFLDESSDSPISHIRTHARTLTRTLMKILLRYASASGNLDVVRWLYKMGCPTTAKNTTDGTTTSLHIACYNNHIDIARFLFKNGAANDRFVFDEAGLLPIHVACVGGHRDIVLWLGRDVDGRSEQKSANGLDVRSKSGLTLMDICSACDHKELAEALRFFGCTHVSSLPPLHGRLEPDDEDRLLEKKYIGKLASLNRPKN